jgi:cellulose biosynthesis protein BcsQ
MIFTSNDVANALFFTADVVRKMVRTGEISIVKQAAGGSFEFSLEDIRAYIQNENYKLPCSVISFANIRHRTGKTMFTICAAEVLKCLGYRVLVIDCDKQGDTSGFFLGKTPPAGTPPITGIFYGDFSDDLIIPTPRGVDLIASNLRHSQIQGPAPLDAYTNLYDYIEQVKDGYDFILLDTPPDNELSFIAPLVASDRVFCVIGPEPSTFDGIDFLYSTVNAVNKTFSGHGPVIFKSCIFNGMPSERKVNKKILEKKRKSGLERNIVNTNRFGKIVNQEKCSFNVFSNYIPESNQYREFYRVGINGDTCSFFESHLSEKYKNSFVYVILEILAELKDHAGDLDRLL